MNETKIADALRAHIERLRASLDAFAALADRLRDPELNGSDKVSVRITTGICADEIDDILRASAGKRLEHGGDDASEESVL